MRRSTASTLLAIVILSVVLRLSPLLSFLYWGSDVGEYFAIVRGLVQGGHMPSAYAGWGFTYPEFPGMFLLQGAFAELGNVALPTVLSIVVPALTGLAVLPLFLITTRITSNAAAGLFAAAFLAIAMPHVYPTSHSVPASLGDLLAISGLLLFLRLRQDPRAAPPLVLVSLALVVTHHLSAYFFLIMVLSTVVVRSFLVPLQWSKGLRRELAFVAFLVLVIFAYWFGYATPFGTGLLRGVNVDPWWLIFVAFAAILTLAAILAVLRRKIVWRYRPTSASWRHSVGIFTLSIAFLFGFAGYLVVGAVPGTSISLSPVVVLAFAPFLTLLALSAPGRKALDFADGGLAPISWLAALVVSSLLGILVAPEVLIPYRHMEYIIMPLAIFLGAGGFLVINLAGLRGRRRTVVLLACGALLLGSVAVAIPPPSFTGGWLEGIRPLALPPAYWLRDHGSGLVAADHRASTIAFGFGGVDATWDTAVGPFVSASYATNDYANVTAPSGTKNVSYVWIDADTRAGVELLPWEPAVPMTDAAVAKFSDAPFVKVFDNGYAQLFWVSPGPSS